MQNETDTITASSVTSVPLILGTLARAKRRGLTAALGVSGPICRDLDAPPADDVSAHPAHDLSAAIDAALNDPRDAHDRVVDDVVDRLLNELSW